MAISASQCKKSLSSTGIDHTKRRSQICPRHGARSLLASFSRRMGRDHKGVTHSCIAREEGLFRFFFSDRLVAILRSVSGGRNFCIVFLCTRTIYVIKNPQSLGCTSVARSHPVHTPPYIRKQTDMGTPKKKTRASSYKQLRRRPFVRRLSSDVHLFDTCRPTSSVIESPTRAHTPPQPRRKVADKY